MLLTVLFCVLLFCVFIVLIALLFNCGIFSISDVLFSKHFNIISFIDLLSSTKLLFDSNKLLLVSTKLLFVCIRFMFVSINLLTILLPQEVVT